MKVREIVADEFETYDDETPVSKLRGAFEETGDRTLVITREGAFEGIVARRDVLSSHQKGGRKAASLVRPVPTVERDEDVREAARLMLAGDTRVLPVLEGETLAGVVRADDLLRAVQPFLSVLAADDVATTDVVTVTPEDSLGAALSTFREERIQHLPVTDAGDVVGIVGLADVLEFVTRESTRSQGGDPDEHMDAASGGHHGGFGAREGESEDLLGLPVRNVMIETLGTARTDEPLDETLETMVEHGASSSIVLDGDGALAGIVTKTDLLESLTWTDEGQLPVQVYGADLLTDLSRAELAERIEAVAEKYAAMRVLDARVHLQEHSERLRGVPLLLARVRLYTDKGLFVASGEGYGDRHAVSLALNAVERQILEGKTHALSEQTTDVDDGSKMYGWWLSD